MAAKFADISLLHRAVPEADPKSLKVVAALEYSVGLLAKMTFCLFATALLCAGSPAASATFYVSPHGNDAWTGMVPSPTADGNDGPFASVTHARDAIRQLKARQGRPLAPITVEIRGGTYYLNETITFTARDSGTRESPISYVAYKGERPLFCAGRAITGWRPYRGNIQRVFIPEVKSGEWYFRSLFVNGERVVRARYPNVVPSDPYRKGFLYARDGDEDVAISGIHNKDDWLLYAIDVPVNGIYAVWMCYGNGMHIDMGGRTSIDVDGSARVPLMHLPDTGGFGAHRWRRAAELRLSAVRHFLKWRNDQAGGLDLDKFAFCDDGEWTPKDGNPASRRSGSRYHR